MRAIGLAEGPHSDEMREAHVRLLGRQRKRYAPVNALAAAKLRTFFTSCRDIEPVPGAVVIHVQAGKPLTEVGAKALGVPWP